jgi:hypothetical protein
VPTTQGIGTANIEKFVDLRLVVNNKAGTSNGSIVLRDGLSTQGAGKLSDGENAFTFDTGTVRLNVNQKTLLQSANFGITSGQSIVGDTTGAGSSAIVGSANITTVAAGVTTASTTNVSVKFAQAAATGTIANPATSGTQTAATVNIAASSFAAAGSPTNTATVTFRGQTISYSASTTKTVSEVAAGLAQAFNANSALAAAGFKATSNATGSLTITRASGVSTGFAATDFQLSGVGVGNSPISVTAQNDGVAQALSVTITTPAVGDKFTVTVNSTQYSYTAKAGEVNSVVSANLAAQINGGVDSANVSASVVAGALVLTDTRDSTATSLFTEATSVSSANVEVKVTDGQHAAVTKTIFSTQSGNQSLNFSLSANGLTSVNLTVNSEQARKNAAVPATAAFGGNPALPAIAGKDASIEIRGFQSSAKQVVDTLQVKGGDTANDLSVQFNESNTTSVQVSSINVQSDGQGLQLDRAKNGWQDRADIDKAVADLSIANSVVRTAASNIATNLQIVQTRQDFTSNFSNVLTDGANKLTQADQNEQGANLLTLQTRQQLGTIALSLANQSQQSILRLF